MSHYPWPDIFDALVSLGELRGERKWAMGKLHQLGFSYRQIGDGFNISRQRVHQIIKDPKGGAS